MSASLRRGVRLELLVAPLSFLLPLGIGLLFVQVGVERRVLPYIALGVLLVVCNTVFNLMMVRNALRFLRKTRIR